MKYLFIDESGDHNLNPHKIDPTFPLFVLTGIVFDAKTYKKFQASLLEFKRGTLGNEKIILHSAELNRPNITKQKQIKNLTNRALRKNFYSALNKLLGSYDFTTIAFVINKPWFANQFSSLPPDPYFLSFSYIFSMFEEQLLARETGEVFVEQRNKVLDKQFLLAWESSRISRVGLVTSKKIKNHKITKPSILMKSWSNAGLELSDLISYRLSRYLMGKKEKVAGNEIDISILKNKNLILAGLPDIPYLSTKK